MTNINDLSDLDRLSLLLTDFKVIGMKKISHESIIVYLSWKKEPTLGYFDWLLVKQKSFVWEVVSLDKGDIII